MKFSLPINFFKKVFPLTAEDEKDGFFKRHERKKIGPGSNFIF